MADVGAESIRQLWIFGQSILLGLCAGVLYDLLRPFRLRAPRFTGLLDGLYCAVVGGGTFLFLLRRAEGQLRGFTALGAVGGAVLYFCAFAPLLRPLWAFWADTLALLAHLLALPLAWLRRAAKKIDRRVKNLFYFWRKCVTIQDRGRFPRKGGRRSGQGKKSSAKKSSAPAC